MSLLFDRACRVDTRAQKARLLPRRRKRRRKRRRERERVFVSRLFFKVGVVFSSLFRAKRRVRLWATAHCVRTNTLYARACDPTKTMSSSMWWFGEKKKNKKKIRDRTTSVLEKASHPLEAVAAKRKQKRATLFEKLENYDEERINRRTELLEKLRERYAERRKKKKKKEEEEEEEEKEDEPPPPPTTSALATAAAKKFKEQDFPTLSPDALDAVVEDMRNGKDKFSMTDAMCIISGATVLFSREPNVCRVYSHEDEDGFVTVVGDIHGQLEDLLHLLKLCGMPSEKNIYVFNGDLVDRGGNGCEVVLLILAMKLQHPQFVHVNRGNHEDPHINIFGGFEEECLKKYDHGVFQAFHECFRWFPICTIVNDHAFVCHGGPPMEPDGTLVSVKRLEQIQKGPSFFESKSARRLTMKRRKKKMLRKMRMEEEREGHGVVAGSNSNVGQKTEPEDDDDDNDDDDDDDDDEELSDDEYDVQIEREFLICKSTIWSDPHPDDNFVGVEDSSRGAGGLFGANVTHEFLKKNKLSCLLRSHQCVASGVETCHDGRLFTVFSASNYCGKSGNRGAILRLKRHDKLPQPKYAMTWKSEDCLNVDLRNRVSFHRKKGDKKRALQMAAIQASEYIIEYNKELFDHWSSIDIKGKGRITREQWADGLQTVLKLRSQWKKMFPMLVSANEVITGGLFSMKLKKTQSVDAMEKASSSSFKKVYVKFPEFLARYTPRLKSGCREWQEEVLDELCQALINEAKNLTSAFEKMDVDGSGSIDSNEFTKAIRNIPNLDVLSNAQILSVFNAFDVDDSGTLDLGEFSAMFEDFIEEEGGNMPKVATSAGSPNSRARNNEVSVLWKDRSSKRRAQITNMVSLSRSFNRLLSLKEKEGKGNATKEELQSITSLNKMLSRGKGINDGSDICFKEENVKISDVWNDDIERAISKLFTGYKKELHHLWHTIIAADSEGEHNKETPRRSISNAHFVDLMLSLDDVINGDLNVLTESSAKRLAEHMDTNKDGTIDYDEFIRATEPDIDQLNRYLVEGQRKAGVV